MFSSGERNKKGDRFLIEILSLKIRFLAVTLSVNDSGMFAEFPA